MPARKSPRPAPRLRTRINWSAEDRAWLRAQQAKVRRGEYGPFASWAQFCKHAIIRATLPDSASGGTVMPVDITMHLSPAAQVKLAQLGLTSKQSK